MIDAEYMQDRRVNVVDVRPFFNCAQTDLVRCADDLPSL